MLTIDKTINLSGKSEIDGQIVAYMNASISTDGSSNASVTKSIVNRDLYEANKENVRDDMKQFEDKVYEIEDSITTKNSFIEFPTAINYEADNITIDKDKLIDNKKSVKKVGK